MSLLVEKLRLPLFWSNLLIDIISAGICIALASFADQLKIAGYEGGDALAILSVVAAVVVAFITILGIIQRPLGLSVAEYFHKRDWKPSQF